MTAPSALTTVSVRTRGHTEIAIDEAPATTSPSISGQLVSTIANTVECSVLSGFSNIYRAQTTPCLDRASRQDQLMVQTVVKRISRVRVRRGNARTTYGSSPSNSGHDVPHRRGSGRL